MICSICHRISATGQDHLDCVQKKSIESKDQSLNGEKLDTSKDLNVEIRAVLEHLAKEQKKS